METKLLHPNRLIIYKLIEDACSTHQIWNELTDKDKQDIIRRIERSCINHTIETCLHNNILSSFVDTRFINRYSNVCSKIIYNLDYNNTKTDYLLRSIINKSININEIANMKSVDLCPEINKDLIEKISLQTQQKVEQRISKLYYCRKCHRNETTLVEYQSRCADEANSISIKCIHCNFVWRQ